MHDIPEAVDDSIAFACDSFVRERIAKLKHVLSMETPPVWRQAIITIRPRRDLSLSLSLFGEVFAPNGRPVAESPCNAKQKGPSGLVNRYHVGSRLANRSKQRICSSRYVHFDSSDVLVWISNYSLHDWKSKSESRYRKTMAAWHTTLRHRGKHYFTVAFDRLGL